MRIRRPAALVLALVAVGLTSAAPAHAASSQVAALQVALGAVGLYSGAIDGISGPATRSAVTAFQSRRGLTADGVAGPSTTAALGARGRPSLGSRPLTVGREGFDVAALQFLLKSRGFGPATVDGGFGPATATAVRAFQTAARLTVDGVAGPATLAALRGGRVVTAATSTRPTASSAPPTDDVRFLRPVPGPFTDAFGFYSGRQHTGLDFPLPSGVPVGAAGRGTVTFAGMNTGGYGNLVVVTHRLGYETWYAHLSVITAVRGQAVAGGSRIGLVGSTGRSTGPHLHFETRRFGTPFDPVPRLLPGVSAARATPRAAVEPTGPGGVAPSGATAPTPAPGSDFGTASGGLRFVPPDRRLTCRANADARAGRDADPRRARLGRCP